MAGRGSGGLGREVPDGIRRETRRCSTAHATASWAMAGWRRHPWSWRSVASVPSPSSSSDRARPRGSLPLLVDREPGAGGSVHASCACLERLRQAASWIRVSGGSLRRTRSVVSSIWWAAPKRQQRSIDRRNGECRPDRAPEPELGGRQRQVELVAVGLLVEPGDQPPQEPRRRRAQQPEPEPLDVGGAHLVTDRVDHRVGPWLHGGAGAIGEGRRRCRTSDACHVVSIFLIPGSRGSLAWPRGSADAGSTRSGGCSPALAASSCSPAPGSAPTAGSPTSAARRGCGPRTRRPRRPPTSPTTSSDPAVRERAWRNRLASPAFSAEPNAGHRALVELERSGRLHTLITQNIDGLHQAAGSDPAKVVEVHGTIREVVCLDCGDRAPDAGRPRPGGRRRGRSAVPACAAGSSSRPRSASGRAWWPRTSSGRWRRRAPPTSCWRWAPRSRCTRPPTSSRSRSRRARRW